DIETAANEVREKVSTVVRDFPPGTDPPVIERFDPDASPIMAIVFSGARLSREVTEIADKKVKRQLETIKDIGAVTLVGDRKREIQIYVDPDRLTAYNLSIQQIKGAIRQQSGTNTVEVVDRVGARLEEIKKTLPQDIRFEIVRDQSRFIRRSIKDVQEHLILGGFLAALVVLFFMRNWRSALIAAISIPA